MIGSDYPVIESDDFGYRECGGIASSLDFKSKSYPKTFCLCTVDCRLLLIMMMFLIERLECDDDVSDRKIGVI